MEGGGLLKVGRERPIGGRTLGQGGELGVGGERHEIGLKLRVAAGGEVVQVLGGGRIHHGGVVGGGAGRHRRRLRHRRHVMRRLERYGRHRMNDVLRLLLRLGRRGTGRRRRGTRRASGVVEAAADDAAAQRVLVGGRRRRRRRGGRRARRRLVTFHAHRLVVGLVVLVVDGEVVGAVAAAVSVVAATVAADDRVDAERQLRRGVIVGERRRLAIGATVRHFRGGRRRNLPNLYGHHYGCCERVERTHIR